jgi:hypothetical protein
MPLRIAGLSLALLLAAGPAAFAQTPTPAAPPRASLASRIRAGVQSGQLTAGEVTRVRARVAALRARAAAFRASGKSLSAAERVELRRAWRGVSRQLFRLKHNRIHRGR